MRSPALTETLRRAIEANLAYYKGVLRLTTDYVRVLSQVAGALAPEESETKGADSAASSPSAPWQPPAPSPAVAPRESAPSPSPAPVDAQLVLRGAPGQLAQAVLRVKNTLPREVKATLRASQVVDAKDRPVEIAMAATPGAVTLAPGAAQHIVISAQIPEGMLPDETYHTVLEIPDLAAQGIAVTIVAVPAELADAAPAQPTSKAVPAKAPRTQPVPKRPNDRRAVNGKTASRKVVTNRLEARKS